MKIENLESIKRFINTFIFLGVIGAGIAFLIAVYQPKQYLVVGKLIVFPAGSTSAQKNLGYEVGNTVEIINSSAFKTSVFQGMAGNFAYARQLDASSAIAIAIYAQEDEQISAEDVIVSIPNALADYTRDLYEGSPFRYKLLGDPEISVSPVKPEITLFLTIGFAIGALLSVLYWFLFDFLRLSAETDSSEIPEKKEREVEIKEKKTVERKVGSGKIVMEGGRPTFSPGEVSREKETKIISPSIPTSDSAPENLPFVDETGSSTKSEEPSDDEVKDRLNRLMRGEL